MFFFKILCKTETGCGNLALREVPDSRPMVVVDELESGEDDSSRVWMLVLDARGGTPEGFRIVNARTMSMLGAGNAGNVDLVPLGSDGCDGAIWEFHATTVGGSGILVLRRGGFDLRLEVSGADPVVREARQGVVATWAFLPVPSFNSAAFSFLPVAATIPPYPEMD